jgi:ATP-dependent RNA helicase UAP56/SUB2
LCQAKAGTGKTAVFTLSILNQMTKDAPPVTALVLCHARELAYQIKKEFARLGKYLNFKTSVFYGDINIEDNKK